MAPISFAWRDEIRPPTDHGDGFNDISASSTVFLLCSGADGKRSEKSKLSSPPQQDDGSGRIAAVPCEPDFASFEVRTASLALHLHTPYSKVSCMGIQTRSSTSG